MLRTNVLSRLYGTNLLNQQLQRRVSAAATASLFARQQLLVPATATSFSQRVRTFSDKPSSSGSATAEHTHEHAHQHSDNGSCCNHSHSHGQHADHQPVKQAESKPFQIPMDKPMYNITFTCTVCKTRSNHFFSKQAYHHGTVMVRCPGCKNHHLMADHLKIFSDTPVTLEDILKGRGQRITTVNLEDSIRLSNEEIVELGATKEIIADVTQFVVAAPDPSKV
ncbi:DNL zinc finger-domain-containing protein [Myxozyma melibiosi]|uniref:DNL zinc finger-domain-containing protein n=1 Tax=Myxozyma melibiosi TaxID=54550 RepID=A0ABR1F4N6_9ASCO